MFSDFFNFEALYLEGWLIKSYEILLVSKKGFRNSCDSNIKQISLTSLELHQEK